MLLLSGIRPRLAAHSGSTSAISSPIRHGFFRYRHVFLCFSQGFHQIVSGMPLNGENVKCGDWRRLLDCSWTRGRLSWHVVH